MPSVPIHCGFVESLEAMPLLSHDDGAQGKTPWHFRASPSYGRILRNLLTGELAAGLVPWELFVTEVLERPGQHHLWSVPLIVHACPTELVLSPRAKKAIYQRRPKSAPAPTAHLTFAIEARRSLTKLQIVAWLDHAAFSLQGQPQFKVLPMDLMLKGLAAGEVDGLVAPTPWGLLAESLGHGSVDASFTQAPFGQELVLACHRRVLKAHSQLFKTLPEAVTSARRRLASPAVFAETARKMSPREGSAFDLALLEAAKAKHVPADAPRDYAPDSECLLKLLQHLARHSLLQASAKDLQLLAPELAV